MPPEDATRVRHMVEAADAVAQFRAVEVLGEAASKVTLETRTTTPTVPWLAIVAMRSRLVHAYFDIDTDILWRTATVEIPRLRERLATILPLA